MADNNILAQALLGQYQQQQRRPRPEDRLARYGEALTQQGSSTAPVQSPLEGLARALQGGLGGLFEGQARQEGEQRDTLTRAALGDMLAAGGDVNKIREIAARKGVDTELLAPFMGQMLVTQMSQGQALANAERGYRAAGGGAPAAGAGGPPLDVTITPNGPRGPAPDQSTAPVPGAGTTIGDIFAGAKAALPGVPLKISSQDRPGDKGQHGASNAIDISTAGLSDEQLKAVTTYFLSHPGVKAFGYEGDHLHIDMRAGPKAPVNAHGKMAFGSGGTTETIGQGWPAWMTPMVQQWAQTPAAGGPAPSPQVAQAGGPPVVPAQGGTPQVAPGAPAPQPQVAQASPPPGFDPGADWQQRSEAAAAEGRATGNPEAFKRATDFLLEAQKARAAFKTERFKTQDERAYKQGETAEERAYKEREHDRQRNTTTMTKEQSDAATFADRMTNSFRILGATEGQGKSVRGRLLDTKVFGVGVPGANLAQSEEYQKFKQAKDDFINAQLRRESGAVISSDEYSTADKQYFPQPGDAPSVVAQKMKNRQLAVEGMRRAAGPTYATNPTVNQPAAGPQPGVVEGGFRFKGGNPGDPNSWEKVK